MKNTEQTDKLVLDLFKRVKQKQKEIKDVEKPKWETSCTVGKNPDSVTDRINIQTVSDVNKLVDLYAFLTQLEQSWKTAAAVLQVPVSKKYMGFEFSAWKTDIQFRASQIGINAKRKELDELEARLNALITVEQRRELELAEISKLAVWDN